GWITPGEEWWCEHEPWLKECGYLLRPRFLPTWNPSWLGKNKFFDDCEDGQGSMVR
ncbi:hypothetical protein DFH09DRAFT_862583, partial [Mycena vulgaris]